MKRALITGITGQDGSYLTELLLSKDYEVHGIVRRTSSMNRGRIDHLRAYEEGPEKRLFLHYGDLSDRSGLVKLFREIRPAEIYNLASQSQVRISFDMAEHTTDINAVGVVRLLEAILESGIADKTRFYQASSSEMFGLPRESPQNEESPFHPRSPYACSKAFAHWLTINYREAHGLFACCGIAYNHESPRRGENFVTRKISLAAARIKLGLQQHLDLGDLDARRDWGHAPEYVEGMWLMLQQERPDDYVLATGKSHSIREFLDAAFSHVDLDWKNHVRFDKRFVRPTEVGQLVGDTSKINIRLGWEPKTAMGELAQLMVDADLTLGRTVESQISFPKGNQPDIERA